MYGVMMPGASAGSNHVGARDTWTPQVISPAAAAAGAPAIPMSSSRASTARSRGREGLMRFLLWSEGCRRDDGLSAATRRPTTAMEGRQGECRNPRLLPEARHDDAVKRHDSLSWPRQLVGARPPTMRVAFRAPRLPALAQR